ncbi:hypothetical protein SSS_05295 [Sarcoptes scabiei]|uniref:CUB domain-containing protein n=1 Tax=Sarcoptes scabiei TaxID=52283 RepID=A0A834R1P8_SARSC|nr:hypothetical protein SSS_05295 [Sarcoptes scabiei]
MTYFQSFWINLLFFAILTRIVSTTITNINYTSLCGRNVTLNRSNFVLEINFGVYDSHLLSVVNHKDCICIIEWRGSNEYRLTPHVIETSTKTNQTRSHYDSKKITLNIKEMHGTIFELKMFGSKDFILAMIPAIILSQNQRCPQNSFDCGSNHCIDRSLICDGTVQCGQIDERFCFESPANLYLISSLLVVFFSCLLLGLLMALCLYFKYHYRLNEKLLPSDIKPKLYGTLNDDHSSISSCNYLDDDEKGTINHYKFVKNSILNSIKFYE